MPVLLEQEDLSYITGAAMKTEVTMMYSVETTKDYSYDHGFIKLLNLITSHRTLEFNNTNGVL